MWKIIEPAKSRGRHPYDLCECECGTRKEVARTNINRGSISCGCKSSRATAKTRFTTHGKSRTTIHSVWKHLRQRCDNPKDAAYDDYGARGITYDPRWAVFENFLADMGEAPEGMTIDRIDNDGNYSKENCRWATKKEQANNRRLRKNSRYFTYDGETLTATQWAIKLGLNRSILYRRRAIGWDDPKIITTPVKVRAHKPNPLSGTELPVR